MKEAVTFSDGGPLATLTRRCLQALRRIPILFVAAFVGSATVAASDELALVRELAGNVGPIVGSASACRDIARPRVEAITDKFQAMIAEIASSEAEGGDLARLLERYIADGRNAVVSGRVDCKIAERQISSIEQSLAGSPSPSSTSPSGPMAPPPAAAATAPSPPIVAATAPRASIAAAPVSGPVRGVTDSEIRFGIVAPFAGSARELGRQMKLGIDTAFNNVNDGGGIEGRMLRLVAADDGYEPSRTLDSMKQLYDKDQVFGFIGNVGTPTAAVAIPFALERRTLFFGALTGEDNLGNAPLDRYVFNYRASYSEETDAVVRYLIKLRKLRPAQIAVFAQQDSYGDAGFAGVAKAMRALGVSGSAILRLGYKRNSLDVDDAIKQLRLQKLPIKAVVMVATYRAAAKFIEKTRILFPDMIYTNVSFVGSTALADELMLLGPHYASGVIVTQVVPAVGGYSSAVLDYKAALAKYFPGETPDYVSFEGYVAANVLIQALKRTGPKLDTERLIDNLEALRDIDLGLGTSLNFGRTEHQASHKVWGTAMDRNGKYQPVTLE